MDAVTREFTHLLTSQLESQRAWFEDLRAQDAVQSSARIAELEAEIGNREQMVAELKLRCVALSIPYLFFNQYLQIWSTHEICRSAKAEAEARSLQKTVSEITEQRQASQKELDVLTELNRGLISNQQTYKDMVSALQAEGKEQNATILVKRPLLLCLLVHTSD